MKLRWILAGCVLLGGCGSRELDPQSTVTNIEPLQEAQPEPVQAVVEQKSTRESWDGLYDEKDVVGRVYFDFDRATLSNQDQKMIRKTVAPILAQHPDQSILLAGYADWYGKDTYNENLGGQRAQSVGVLLVDCGIDPARMVVVSLGNYSATPKLSKPDAKKDRRCDIVLKPKLH